jgi:hypothetical protein
MNDELRQSAFIISNPLLPLSREIDNETISAHRQFLYARVYSEDAQIYRVAQERRANRPSIWLITSFSESGLACEMIIEKRRATGSAIDYEGLLSPSEVGASLMS